MSIANIAKCTFIELLTGEDEVQTTTILVIADFDTQRGLDLGIEALRSLGPDQASTRLAFVQNGPFIAESSASLGQFVRQSSIGGKALPLGFWKLLLDRIAAGDSFIDSFKDASSLHPEIAMIGMEGSVGLEEEGDKSRRAFLRDILKMKEGDIAFVVNGRVRMHGSFFQKRGENKSSVVPTLFSFASGGRTH